MLQARALGLQEQLALLTMSRHYGLFTRLGLDSAISAAILAELHFQGRIRMAGKRLDLVSDELPGDPVLDQAIKAIASHVKTYRASRFFRFFRSSRASRNSRMLRIDRWIAKLIRINPHEKVMKGLKRKSVVRLSRNTALGFWITDRYVYENSMIEREWLRFLRAPMLYGSSVDIRTAALIGLAQATGLLGSIVPVADLRRSRRNVRALVEQAGDVIAASRRVIYLARLMPIFVAALYLAGLLFDLLWD